MYRFWFQALFIHSALLLLLAATIAIARQEDELSPYWAMIYNTGKQDSLQSSKNVYLYHPATGLERQLMQFASQYDATSILSGYKFTITPDQAWFWFPANINRRTRRFDSIARYHWTGVQGDSLSIPPLDLDIVFQSFRWSRKDEWAIFTYPDENNNLILYRIDATTGELSAIHSEFPFSHTPTIMWMDDHKAIIRDPNPAADFSLYEVDFASWTLRRIILVGCCKDIPVLSPSATYIAYIASDLERNNDTIVVTDVEGNIIREVEVETTFGSLVWQNDNVLLGFVMAGTEPQIFGLRLMVSDGLRLYSSLHDISTSNDVYWSPNRLYYAVTPNGDEQDQHSSFTSRIYSNQHTLLTEITTQQGCQPANRQYWSPDGQWFMYWERDGNECWIRRVQVDGTRNRPLYAIPNESRIAFVRTTPNDDWIELVVYDASGNRSPSRLIDIKRGRAIPMPENGVIETWIVPDISAGDETEAAVGGVILTLISGLGMLCFHH